MKTKVMVTSMVIFLFAVPLFAKDAAEKNPLSKEQIAFVKIIILMGLRSGNSGLIESCLIFISKIKIYNQETSVAEVVPIIDSPALASPSGSFRYKAFLTSTICLHQEWFDMDIELNTSHADTSFASAVHLLKHKMLSSAAS